MLENVLFYTRHSFNDLRVNGQRTLFALLCIAAGVAAIVSLQTLGVMIDDSLTGNLQESNRGDFRVSIGFDFDGDDDGPVSGTTYDRGVQLGYIAEGDEFSTDFITQNGIFAIHDWFESNYEGEVNYTYRQPINYGTEGFSITDVDQDTDKVFIASYIVDADVYPFYGERRDEQGRPLGELLQGPNDIVLSRNLADDLGAQVGDTIRVLGATEDFVLKGIMATEEEGGFENILGSLFGYYFLDTSALQVFPNFTPGADQVYIQVEDADAEEIERLERAFERRFPYFDAFSTVELEEMNSVASETTNQFVTIMGLVSLLIGGIGIINTMLVIVSRRTTEIAVLKTIGLEADQVTTLFLVEAVLMGIAGSLLGILGGWVAARGIQSVAEGFLATELVFRVTFQPAITGFLVGIIITAIFGFIPTLAAGQVRPSLVLRPSDSVVPRAGRARSFAALLFVILSLSLVAQTLINSLLEDAGLENIGAYIGLGMGGLIGLSMLAAGMYAGWARGNILLRIIRWIAYPVGLAALGYVFGTQVPALLLIFGAFIMVGVLYTVLWILIWMVGGGELRELWIFKWRGLRRFQQNLSADNTLLGYAFWLLMPLVLVAWALNAVVVIVMIPFWLLGRLIQRVAFVDLRVAMRSMLASKGRNASTLLALVIGVFTLGMITMLVDTINNFFEQILENEAGGNVVIFAAGSDNTLARINTVLDDFQERGEVLSYSSLATWDTDLVEFYDVDAESRVFPSQMELRAQRGDPNVDGDSVTDGWWSIDSRGLNSNLPDVDFYQGRQLDPELDTGPWDPENGDYPPIVISADEAFIATGIEVGDRVTLRVTSAEGVNLFGGGDELEPVEITFEIIGMVDRRGADIELNFGSQHYVPRAALPEDFRASSVNAIVDVKESSIRDLRREINQISGVFFLETRLLNELISGLIEQFTSFPVLVATLSLVVGGIVIANSVALSTLERRREIAIMKSVGLQRERVLGMLLMEFGLMGFIGGLIGVGMGALLLLLMLTSLFEGALGEVIPWLTALELMALCIAIALVAAMLSAWQASGEKPLNVLRYE